MWWQNFSPAPQILSLGAININWYGVLLVLGIVVAGYLARKKLAQDAIINHRQFEDLFFYAVVFGLIGARIGHVIFEFSYYKIHPEQIIQIWRGGISLYGSFLGGALAVWWWCKKYKIKFLHLSDRILPFFALAQSIGRWGNYFNQELFGRPTDSWWGIYIDSNHRPLGFDQQSHYQPAFFYESVLNFILFLVLIGLAKKKQPDGRMTYLYIMGYSSIRFFMEFIRVDATATIGILRLPQLLSLLFFFCGLYLFVRRPHRTLSKT